MPNEINLQMHKNDKLLLKIRQLKMANNQNETTNTQIMLQP